MGIQIQKLSEIANAIRTKEDSGVAGLFDLVGEQFYSNRYSGTITSGPEI